MPRIITLFVISFLVCSLQAQVRAYTEAGFHGKEIVLKPGKYSAEQLSAKGITSVQSLRIPKGCNVKQYPTANLQGEATSYSKNKPLVKAASKQSIKVACKSSGTGFAIAASDEFGQKGDLITVDVNVGDFNGVVSMQYSMNWNPAILQFEKVEGFKLKDLSADNFGSEQAKDGNLLMAWYDPSVRGVTLDNGTVIYKAIFRVIGEDTSKSRIRFSGKPLLIEVMRVDGTPLPFNNTNGSFTFEK